MRHILKVICMVSLFAIGGCETVLGPPGSEPVLPPPVAAPRYDMFIEGEPAGLRGTLREGYYIWKDATTWHLRVARYRITDVWVRDIFTGAVMIENGFIISVDKRQAMPFDEVRFSPGDLSFKIETERDVAKGFDFRVQPRGLDYCVSFDLRINGAVRPDLVRLGRSMFVPREMPLRICVRQ